MEDGKGLCRVECHTMRLKFKIMKREIQFQHPGREQQLESTRYKCSHSLGVLFQVHLARPETRRGERRLHALPRHTHVLTHGGSRVGGDTPSLHRQGNTGPLTVSWDLDTGPLILTTTFFPTKNTLLHQECTLSAPAGKGWLPTNLPIFAICVSPPPRAHTHRAHFLHPSIRVNSFFLKAPGACGFPTNQLSLMSDEAAHPA